MSYFLRTFLLLVVAFVGGFALSTLYPPVNMESFIPNIFKEERKTFSGITLSGLSLERVNQAYKTLEENYYWFNTLNKEDLVTGMIRGMVDSLKDPHSIYFDEEETKKFEEAIAGNFEWIGAYVGKTGSGVLIRRVFEGSPASEGGLQEGDIIQKADGVSLVGLDIEEAVKKIRWPALSTVEIQFVRPTDKNAQITKKIIRRKVQVPTLVAKMVPKSKTGIITFWIFGKASEEEFKKSYQNLLLSGATTVVVDLRDNPGGLLDAAVNILSEFIERWEVIVETKSTLPELNQKIFSEGGVLKKVPLVVLVNENSASASEIFAGVIQDYSLGIVVGEKTYGKGSVQEAFPQKGATELKITVARWYTPKGRWIDKIGIEPDIIQKILPEDYEKWFDRVLETGKKIAEQYNLGTSRKDIITSNTSTLPTP